jgi:hypothetical protein
LGVICILPSLGASRETGCFLTDKVEIFPDSISQDTGGLSNLFFRGEGQRSRPEGRGAARAKKTAGRKPAVSAGTIRMGQRGDEKRVAGCPPRQHPRIGKDPIRLPFSFQLQAFYFRM